MLDISRITEWNYCKNLIRLCLRPVGKGRPQDVSGSYLDMEIYLRVINGDYSAVVTTEMLRIWNVSKEEAIIQATTNTERDTEINLLYEIINEFMGNMTKPSLPNVLKDYVISTKDKTFGAAAIVCESFLKELAIEFNSDVLILPSSIHEIIVRPADITLSKANELVKEVNLQEVDSKEILSDHAYIYLKNEDRIIY